MSLVVLDIECIENKIVKELGVIKMNKLWDITFFLPPKSSKLHLSCYEKYTELQKILKKLKPPETEFFATGY